MNVLRSAIAVTLAAALWAAPAPRDPVPARPQDGVAVALDQRRLLSMSPRSRAT